MRAASRRILALFADCTQKFTFIPWRNGCAWKDGISVPNTCVPREDRRRSRPRRTDSRRGTSGSLRHSKPAANGHSAALSIARPGDSAGRPNCRQSFSLHARSGHGHRWLRVRGTALTWHEANRVFFFETHFQGARHPTTAGFYVWAAIDM